LALGCTYKSGYDRKEDFNIIVQIIDIIKPTTEKPFEKALKHFHYLAPKWSNAFRIGLVIKGSVIFAVSEMKESMSNIDIRLILPEIAEAAEGAFIKNVYQYGDVFVFKLYQPAVGTKQLLIQPGRRIHLTEFRRVAPKVPPKFCTILRKYLRDRRVISVIQHDLDRIIVIEVGDEESTHKIVAELFGNGNLLLLDPNDVIFVAMRYKRMRDRDIMPKAPYEFPPPRGVDVLSLDQEAFISTISDSTSNLVRTLASRLNIDALSCEEICTLSGVSPKTTVSEMDEQSLEDLQTGLNEFLDRIRTGVDSPRIVYEELEEEEPEPELLAFTPFEFQIYNELQSETYATFSQTLDQFYGISESEQIDDGIYDAFEKKKKRLQKIIEKQQESIQRLEAKAESFRLSGELIYAHFQIVQDILETITQARSEGHSWAEIKKRIEEGKATGNKSALLIERILPSQAQVVVKLNDAEVGLDIRYNAQENASRAYEAAKKAESKTDGARRQIEKTQSELDKLDEQDIEPMDQKAPVKLRKRHWYEKFRWFFSSEGFLILGGRDVKTNEQLIKRHMGANDVFLHAALHGAPYVLVKVPDTAPAEQTLKEAAQFAVTFSSAWRDGLSSGDAYWVDPEQVSFTPPSGEYLPTGGIIVRGTKNYIKHVSVEFAVGVLFEDNHAIPMSGPPFAVETHTEYHVRVAPDGGKKGQLVKELIVQLKRLVPEEKIEMVTQISHEDLMRVLPAGGGKVVL
jgi:predicted ribosome quality control (RQC) complex YloA/Tae2 family protein